jgi:hypothetical protein
LSSKRQGISPLVQRPIPIQALEIAQPLSFRL